MRSFDVIAKIYKSSNDELISEKKSFLEHKDNIIKSLISTLDDMQEEQKKDEEPLLMYCANCRKKHLLGKCPLSSLKVWKIYEEGHATELYPSQPRFLEAFRKSSKELIELLGISQTP